VRGHHPDGRIFLSAGHPPRWWKTSDSSQLKRSGQSPRPTRRTYARLSPRGCATPNAHTEPAWRSPRGDTAQEPSATGASHPRGDEALLAECRSEAISGRFADETAAGSRPPPQGPDADGTVPSRQGFVSAEEDGSSKPAVGSSSYSSRHLGGSRLIFRRSKKRCDRATPHQSCVPRNRLRVQGVCHVFACSSSHRSAPSAYNPLPPKRVRITMNSSGVDLAAAAITIPMASPRSSHIPPIRSPARGRGPEAEVPRYPSETPEPPARDVRARLLRVLVPRSHSATGRQRHTVILSAEGAKGGSPKRKPYDAEASHHATAQSSHLSSKPRGNDKTRPQVDRRGGNIRVVQERRGKLRSRRTTWSEPEPLHGPQNHDAPTTDRHVRHDRLAREERPVSRQTAVGSSRISHDGLHASDGARVITAPPLLRAP
jgi:hypothetical protein